MRYRRHGSARKVPAARTVKDAPTEQIELRVRARDDARWRRIMLLNQRISAALSGELRDTWLALEENLHEHWLDVALEHYMAGFKAGLAEGSRGVPTSTSTSSDVRARLQTLVAELAQLLAEFAPREPREPPR